MNRQDIEYRLFQKSGHIKEGFTQLENLEHFRKYGGIKSPKEEYQDWFKSQTIASLEIGLTLMPVRVLPCGQRPREYEPKKYLRRMNRDELYQAGVKFTEILNKLTFKKAYERNGKRLFIVMTIEGKKSLKDLHLHFVFNKPEHLTHREFATVIKRAIVMSREFCLESTKWKRKKTSAERRQYKMETIDEGWNWYITKESDKQHTDNLYFP